MSMMTFFSPWRSPSQWWTRSARSRNAAFDPVPKIIPIRVAGSTRAPSTYIFSPIPERKCEKYENFFFLSLIFALELNTVNLNFKLPACRWCRWGCREHWCCSSRSSGATTEAAQRHPNWRPRDNWTISSMWRAQRNSASVVSSEMRM